MIKERPILFNAPMVRALLDGTKNQTRRVVKLTDAAHLKEPNGHRRWHPGDPDAVAACPYGQFGDRLWVRETWLKTNPFTDGGLHTYGYRATDDAEFPDAIWKPSIHMPRVVSRITLEITSVRVDRVHEISRGDAMAEGCPFQNRAEGGNPRYWYEELWESINGAGSWAANPWVWVVEFKRSQP